MLLSGMMRSADHTHRHAVQTPITQCMVCRLWGNSYLASRPHRCGSTVEGRGRPSVGHELLVRVYTRLRASSSEPGQGQGQETTAPPSPCPPPPPEGTCSALSPSRREIEVFYIVGKLCGVIFVYLGKSRVCILVIRVRVHEFYCRVKVFISLPLFLSCLYLSSFHLVLRGRDGEEWCGQALR